MNRLILTLIAVTTIWLAATVSSAFATDKAGNSAEPKPGASAETSSVASGETEGETDGESVSGAAGEKNAEQLAIILAVEADEEYGAYLSGECLTCHTPSGGDGSIPQIHAKKKDYIASALLEYKNKQRANEVMQGVAQALDNEAIAALAVYFSKQ